MEADASKADAPHRSPQVRVPIRFKITLPYLVLALILAVGATYVVTQIVFDTDEERYTNHLIESGKLAAEWMTQEESARLETLRLLANAQGIPEAVRAKDTEKLRELALGITIAHQEEAVEFLDARGDLLLSIRHKPGGRLEEYAYAKLGDNSFLQWPFVRSVIDRQVDPRGDKYSGWVKNDWGVYFYVCGPLYDTNGEFVGAILVGKTLANLSKEMQEGLAAQVSLYDMAGDPLASTLLIDRSELALLPQQATTVLQRQEDSSLRRSNLIAANIQYDELLGPWEVRGRSDIGVIGVALPKTRWAKLSLVTRAQIIGLVGVTLFMVILLGFNLASYITRPLIGLVSASSRVADGDLGIIVATNGNDEVAVLAQTFNQMIASIKESKDELLEAYNSSLEGWSAALDLRDRETGEHSKRLTEMTLRLAREYDFRPEQLVHIWRGALLHDIGKMGIPDQILNKEGYFNPGEREIMHRHPELAYEMLSSIKFLKPAIPIPYCHHERWDGSGYPRGLKGEQIPLEARIFAVVDVWDAMTSTRPYRQALPPEAALQEIKAGSGTQFDPQVVEVFLKVIAEDPDLPS